MPKQYSCDLCKKTFNQKCDYDKHINKKTPCITLDEMREISQTKEVRTGKKGDVINILNNCLNILRDNEGLTGEKALRNMSYFLILKLIEQHFGKEIDIDSFEYDFSHIECDNVENHKMKLLEIVRFSNLANEKEDNITTIMKYLWDDILSKHPSTKNIFLEGKGFDIQRQSTYKNLMNKLKTLPDTDYDILGDAYEEIIKGIMTGKVLGQFFTPPLVKRMMVKLIDPQIYPDGTIDTCCDPTMGTGGFLITYMKNIMEQAENKKIKLDWDFVKNDGLYGKELEPDTYQLAVSNMFITSGHMFDKLDRGDSIRDPIIRKFDNILANPPFGIKGLKYDEYNSLMKDKYTPIKTDNAVSLFTQAIIHMLKINGKCAVVLPDGKELFSKTDKTLIAIREYLLKTCDVKEIIYLPSGIFTYTPIKTCVFYFVKKREGDEVLDTKINISKTHKETGRDYKFSKTHQTSNIKFYDYNPYNDVKNLLADVPIDKLANNSYSLNYAEYMKDDAEEAQYEEDVVVKTLGEVCEVNQGNSLTKTEMIDGIYDVIGGGKIIGKHNQKNREGNDFTLTRVGDININYIDKPYYLTDNGFSLKSKQEDIMTKYIYYLLSHNKDYLTNLYQGTAQKVISKTNLKSIKIPIPTLERQQEIVEYLDFIYEKATKTSNKKIVELKKLNEFCLNNQKTFGENAVKTLDEVCSIDIGGTPLRCNNEYYENGNNLWVSVRELNGGYIYDTKEKITDLGVKKSSVKLFAKGTILFSFKLSIGKTALVGNPLYTNEAIAGILSINEILLSNKYLYYYLTINDFSKLGSGMFAKGSLNKTSLGLLKIPIPTLERQQEIVEYCEYNDSLIKQLEKEIENNKKQATQFLAAILQSE